LAVSNRQFSLGEYQVSRTARKATLNVGYPAIDDDGNLRAVVYAALDLNWLQTMLTNSTLPPGSSLTVIDRNRVTLVRYPDPEGKLLGAVLPGRSARTNETPSLLRTNPPPPRAGLRQRGGARGYERTEILTGRDGVRRLYAFTRLGHASDSNPVSVTVGIPVSEAYAPANRALRRNLLTLALVTLVAIGAVWLGGEVFILRRVKALVKATHRIAGGDYAARVGGPYGKGELHQLSKDFDAMATALQRRVEEREQAEANLRRLNQQLEKRVAQRTAQLKRSNEDLEQFAYVASHDLQEPLRVVSKYLTLIRERHESQLEPKAREFLGYALEGATQMQELIMALLAYSRVDTQGQPFTRTDCAQVLERVRQGLKLAIEESHAVLTADPLPTIEADEVQLGQLFQNLLSNAIKFRRDQPPAIHIGARRENGSWHFSVRDNGIGIAAESFPRMFVLFQRFHSRSKYPGTGIGLSICKKIVERHGGRIWVESKVGEGTTFHFTLPTAAGTKPDEAKV
jgi:signal transduction histidine kinase